MDRYMISVAIIYYAIKMVYKIIFYHPGINQYFVTVLYPQ